MSGIPLPVADRAELEAMVVKDLLGPAECPEEELDEHSMPDHYLLAVRAIWQLITGAW